VIKRFKYSSFNTKPVKVCDTGGCSTHNVHSEHYNPKDAAIVLNDITDRNKKLIKHLNKKYNADLNTSIGNGKRGAIDVIHASEIYNPSDIINFINKPLNREYIQERVSQLISKYDNDKIYEISPLNKAGATSYTENKTKLILCLREKHKTDGDHQLHDINILMFVVLHELAHMMNNSWGHPQQFWVLFKFMLLNAVEAGIYKPKNYRHNNITYCGLKITYNPLFDDKL
jgi:hypothetical protein